jgi:hypothetical protein
MVSVWPVSDAIFDGVTHSKHHSGGQLQHNWVQVLAPFPAITSAGTPFRNGSVRAAANGSVGRSSATATPGRRIGPTR